MTLPCDYIMTSKRDVDIGHVTRLLRETNHNCLADKHVTQLQSLYKRTPTRMTYRVFPESTTPKIPPGQSVLATAAILPVSAFASHFVFACHVMFWILLPG